MKIRSLRLPHHILNASLEVCVVLFCLDQFLVDLHIRSVFKALEKDRKNKTQIAFKAVALCNVYLQHYHQGNKEHLLAMEYAHHDFAVLEIMHIHADHSLIQRHAPVEYD